MVQHISFSGFKIWDECPHRFKIEYIDGKKGFTGNIFTAFGTAIHEVCEKTLLNEWKTGEEAQNFSQSFLIVTGKPFFPSMYSILKR